MLGVFFHRLSNDTSRLIAGLLAHLVRLLLGRSFPARRTLARGRSQLSASEQVDRVEGEAEALDGGLVIIGRGQTFELGVARVRQAARV